MNCTCGCGGGRADVDRAGPPPGLPAIPYRAGEHGTFLAAMLARLSSMPELARFTARTPDDPAIALLDAAAVLGDLLTFYSERIADEGYLRTATEDRSLRLLGRLVGYAPRPGVAAGTYLAFTADRDAAQRDVDVPVPAGTRAQSVPAPGQDAQPFETGEDLVARWSLNDMPVQVNRPIQVSPGDLAGLLELTLAGAGLNLKPADRLLFDFGPDVTGSPQLLVLSTVREDVAARRTVIGFTAQAAANSLQQQLFAAVEQARTDPMYERSRIVRRYVDRDLAPLPESFAATPDPRARLGEALGRADAAAAEGRAYDSVRAWFAGHRDRLAQLHDEAPPPSAAPPAPLFRQLALDAATPPNPALAGIAALLGPLRRPPSRPPASARQLDRKPAEIFAPGSDFGAQLLTAVDPRLRNLYPAWRQINVAQEQELKGLQAMRVTAAPFGATAPDRVTFNNQGVVTGVIEWPLGRADELALRVTYADRMPSVIQFSYTSPEGVTWTARADIEDGDDEFALGPWQVSLVVTQPAEDGGGVGVAPGADGPEPGVEVSFSQDGAAAFAVTLPRTPATAPVSVTVHNGTSLSLPVTSQSQSGSQGGRTVSVRRTSGDNPNPRFTLTLATSTPFARNVIALDAVYEGIALDSWVVVERPGRQMTLFTRVDEVRTVALAAFGITGKVTQLVLRDNWLDPADTLLTHIRDTIVYARGERLDLATEEDPSDVEGDRIELAALHEGIEPGRLIVVTGERTDVDAPGVTGTEVVMVAAVEQFVDDRRPTALIHTVLTLAVPLNFTYRRSTVRCLGNVARATHGAGREEVIGSGDASRAGQTFTLFQGPLGWVAADTPLGAENTLVVRVDGVRWHEVDDFAGRGPHERIYTTSTGDDGRTRVTFGDGVNGARLPTGVENVRAAYRVGVGAAGNVSERQITQLVSRPAGVSGVTNPVPADGGADADDAHQLRRGIPVAVAALDRLVGVPDYEDFARARAGIGRASARRLHDGTRELVHVTVAGSGDIPLADDSDIVVALRASLVSFGDPRLATEVGVREAVLLLAAATVKVLPDFSYELVEPAIRAAVLDRLGFAARELGQPAYRSELEAAVQSVPGVDHVTVDVFADVPGSLTPDDLQNLPGRITTLAKAVPARPARFDETRFTVPGGGAMPLRAVAAANGISVARLLALNPALPPDAGVPGGTELVVFRGIRPAQLVMFSADLPDTLILREATS
ncbi:putative baseplate assembly protein [Nucisporomicrobium flavum]|uniref:putative baseplate assembly protein n=1 Tax=Nucisporomicrobium flavum TaxID=2785915 RepID=UPI0018F64986|nr:putative baseplate assembly protein [Nucisporomicrobium flavum]